MFNKFGFDYTDNALSGIKDVVFGKTLPPQTTFSFTNSKVQRIWYPSHLSSFGISQATNCSELKTVMLADYTPGNMDKTFFLRARAFYNCPNLCRVEVPALSVFSSGVGHFNNTPLSATIPERPDILPGVWLYGYLSGETHARQTLSAIWDTITPDKIHVASILGTPVGVGGEYLPLSGGTMTGELSIAIPGNALAVFDGDTITLGPGEAGETTVGFPIIGGSHDVAYKDLTWQKSDTELSVGVGRYKAYVEPGELLAMDEGGGGPDP